MYDPAENQGYIKKEVDSYGVARIEFGHPSHNAFPAALLKELAATITEAGKDQSVKVLLLKSDGNRSFCAGASFDELIDIKTESAGKTFFSGFAYVFNAIRLCKKMVIAQVQGKAIGGGVGLVAACDYVFATQQAQIRLSELGINIGPFVIAPVVKRKIGLVPFVELTLNPDQWRDAPWAKQHGLFQEIFDTMEEMEEAATGFSKRLASYNIDALRALKKVFWDGTEGWDTLLYENAAISGKLVLNKDAKESLKKIKRRK